MLDAIKQINTVKDDNGSFVINQLNESFKEMKLQHPNRRSNVALVINKIDLSTKRAHELNLSKSIETLQTKYPGLFESVFKVSTFSGEGMKELSQFLASKAELKPWTYHPDCKVVKSQLQRVADVIREKIFCYFNQEVPYNVFQENLDWTVYADGGLRIEQALYVRTDSMKVFLFSLESLSLFHSSDVGKY